MKRTPVIITGAVIGGILVAGTLALATRPVQENIPGSANAETASSVISACANSPQDQKAQCVATAALTSYDAIGDLPGILAEVDRQVSENPGLRGVNCHGTFHEIGKAAFARLGDQALSNGAALCSGGYYHGVLQAGGNLDQARALCATLSDDNAKADCMHGAGHARYLADPNLTSAQAFCDSDKYDACLAGFFMELSAANQRDIGGLKYCSEPGLDETALGACYNGLLGDIAINHPTEVARWCAKNATADRLPANCWGELGAGLASGGNERNPSDDAALKQEITRTCDGNSSCLANAARVLRDYFQRGSLADQVCAAIKTSSAPADNRYASGCPA